MDTPLGPNTPASVRTERETLPRHLDISDKISQQHLHLENV